MNKLITADNGGLPLLLDDLRWFLGQSDSDSGIYQLLNSLLRTYGDNFKIYGVAPSGGVAVNEGWIMLDGEILKVDTHTSSDVYFSKVTTYDSSGNKSFESGTSVDTYQKNRGVANASSGNLRVDTGITLQELVRNSVYIDKGDPSSPNFGIGGGEFTTITADNAWHDMDLSSLISSSANLVHLRVEQFVGPVTAPDVYIREKGNSNTVNGFQNTPGVVPYVPIGLSTGGYKVMSDVWIKVDSTKTIEYKISSSSGAYFYVTVAGWM